MQTGAQILAALEVINVLGGIFYVDDSLIDGKNIIRYSGLVWIVSIVLRNIENVSEIFKNYLYEIVQR